MVLQIIFLITKMKVLVFDHCTYIEQTFLLYTLVKVVLSVQFSVLVSKDEKDLKGHHK